MKDFERKIIEDLIECSPLIQYQLKDHYPEENIEYSGAGYFLTIYDRSLPHDRIVLSSPTISGRLGKVIVGYLVFIEEHELTLECYVLGDESIGKKDRDGHFVHAYT